MLKQLTALLVATTLFFTTLPAQAALNAYLTLKGKVSGDIKGSVTQKGRENSILVFAYQHEMSTPIDTKSGASTGKLQHGVLKITKELDKSSPLLMKAWSSNEGMTEFTLRFWEPKPTGVEAQHFTVKLTNARIVGIKSFLPNTKDANLMKLP
ncbi:MAG TPA: type VI secretion system tube protein TssD, partial [Polyangiaceae bacterium]|nr:type VI secretion system tube protein TssD [Polyangiaceae bacterium]